MKRHAPEPEVPTLRTRTPPDIKWLLNERAALAGEVSKAEVTQAGLRAKQARLEQQLAKAQFLTERAQCAQSRAQASMDALDATLALAHARVEPTAGGIVEAWAGRYGRRGALGAFVQEVLSAAAPEPLTTTVLMNLAARQFGITFPLSKDRRSFNKSVSGSLRGLHLRGLIEPLHDRQLGSHGRWRWKAPAASLDALRERAAEHSLEGAQAWR